MSTIITTKTYYEGALAVTPLQVWTDTAQNLAAGAKFAKALPTSQTVGIMQGEIAFTAVGTVLAYCLPVFSTLVGLTGGTQYYGRAIQFADVPLAKTIICFEAINYDVGSLYFGLWSSTPTGTFTVDYSFRWYPIT
jgi:hypothetical protein